MKWFVSSTHVIDWSTKQILSFLLLVCTKETTGLRKALSQIIGSSLLIGLRDKPPFQFFKRWGQDAIVLMVWLPCWYITCIF